MSNTQEQIPFSETFNVTKVGGKLTPVTREIFAEMINTAPDGDIQVSMKATNAKFTPTRYKYYFACFLPCIFFQAREDYLIIERNFETGEVIQRAPKDKAELHECLKSTFNSKTVINKLTGKTYSSAMSTTTLSDKRFIGEYLEEMTEKYINPPYLSNIVFYEEWKQANSETGEGLHSLKERIEYFIQGYK